MFCFPTRRHCLNYRFGCSVRACVASPKFMVPNRFAWPQICVDVAPPLALLGLELDPPRARHPPKPRSSLMEAAILAF